MTKYILGHPITWQPVTSAQRSAQEKHGKDTWVIARQGTYTLLSGEVCVLICPKNKFHEARWVRQTEVILLPHITEPEVPRYGINPVSEPDAQAA